MIVPSTSVRLCRDQWHGSDERLEWHSVIGMRVAPFLVLAMAALSAPRSDHLTVGFGQIPPLHYSDEHGRATGFIVDAVNTAAQREGIEVVWKRVAGSNDIEEALGEGRIDIFPAGIVTPSRQARFSVSEPWWSEDLSILARADIGSGRNIIWRGRRVVLASRAYLPLASRILPDAQFNVPGPREQRGGPEKTASIICRGQADGALIPHTEVDEVLMKRPEPCRGIDFQIVETSEILPLVVISRRETSGLARRLRDRIDELARDGTLGNLAARYPRTPSRTAVMLAETVRLRYQRRALWMALCTALLVVAITAILFIRQVRVQRALRRAIAEQARTDRMLRSRTDELTVSNEELQAFAYSVSHDLREPLRMISLYTQMLERHCPPTSEDGRNCLNTIRSGASRMQEMMDNLLLLSRVGRSDVPRVGVAIADILATVLHDLEPVITATSARIIIGPMPVIDGWPDRLNVLFQNLIGNALKYRREGVTPRIDISAVEQEGEWCFALRDNGIGFDQQYAEKIFGVFKRLHVYDKYGGTGVGLAIAKRVVERHGGRMWAEGWPDKGSTFYFTLPVRTTDKIAPPASQDSHLPADLYEDKPRA